MEEIAKNNFYELSVNNSKNRVHFKIKGTWTSVADVPNFMDDWRKTVSNLKQGFTIEGDLTEMQPFPSDCEKLNTEAQVYVMQNGCRRVAQIASNSLIVMQINNLSDDSGMMSILKAFDNFPDAEKWLDE